MADGRDQDVAREVQRLLKSVPIAAVQSPLSERLPPDEVVARLNRFCKVAADAVFYLDDTCRWLTNQEPDAAPSSAKIGSKAEPVAVWTLYIWAAGTDSNTLDAALPSLTACRSETQAEAVWMPRR